MSSSIDPEAAIRNGFFNFLRAASVPAGDDILTELQVIPANDGGVRPTLPYLTINVSVIGAQVGQDEDLPGTDGGGNPTMRHRGERRATVSVQGFGARTAGWLTSAVLRLRADAIKAIVDTAGLSINGWTPLQKVSGLVDTSIEARFSQDFTVDYNITTAPEAQTEMVNVEVATTLESEHPSGDLSFTVKAPNAP